MTYTISPNTAVALAANPSYIFVWNLKLVLMLKMCSSPGEESLTSTTMETVFQGSSLDSLVMSRRSLV